MKADTAANMTRLLNGLVLGKRNLVMGRDQSVTPAVAPNNLFKHPVAGLTLIFTTPGGTVTFSGNLDLNEIVSEINVAFSGEYAHLYKMDSNGGMVLALWNDTTPVVLADTGTANSYFGFSTTVSDTNLVQAPIDPLDLIEIVIEPLSRQYVTFYSE